jgi:predicted transposase YdaD
MPELSNPHDRFFKQVMARKEIASDFLRYYLPAEVSSLLDHAALQVMKDSYVDGGLR